MEAGLAAMRRGGAGDAQHHHRGPRVVALLQSLGANVTALDVTFQKAWTWSCSADEARPKVDGGIVRVVGRLREWVGGGFWGEEMVLGVCGGE